MRLIGLLLAAFLPCLLRAGEAEKPLEVRLISENRSIAPGKVFFMGLHLIHPPGSHTYWKFPGIVGLATSVEWELPPGFSAGEIQWPAPRVVKMASYDAQGYEGETLLIIPITPPEVLTAASVKLTAKVSWMCCGKTCHPAVNVPFSVSLPVSGRPEPDIPTNTLFLKYRSLVPKSDPSWKTTATREQGKIILTLQPATAVSNPAGIRFFSSDGQVDSNQKQLVELLPNGDMRMTLIPVESALAAFGKLTGVVSFPHGWRGDEPPLHLEIGTSPAIDAGHL